MQGTWCPTRTQRLEPLALIAAGPHLQSADVQAVGRAQSTLAVAARWCMHDTEAVQRGVCMSMTLRMFGEQLGSDMATLVCMQGGAAAPATSGSMSLADWDVVKAECDLADIISTPSVKAIQRTLAQCMSL